VRRLLGSPALVEHLEGVEKDVAIRGYEDALRTLFLAGAGLAAMMVFVQAGTGWKAAEEPDETSTLEEERQALISRGAEDEET